MTVGTVQSMLGEALLGQERYDAAEPLLLEGHKGLRGLAAKAPGKQIDNSEREARSRLIRLYDAWGKKAEAERWRAKQELKP